MIGDDNIKDINVRWLRQHIGIVSQEPVLFDMSIADNIRMGKDDATQDEIEQAAINANAHDFITNLPKVCKKSTILQRISIFLSEILDSLQT